MPAFTYSAAGRDGAVAKGSREAEDEKALARALKEEGLFLLEADAGESRLAVAGVFDYAKALIARIRGVGLLDRIFFSRTLSVMIHAGIPLTRSLEAFEEQTANMKFKKALANIREAVTKGDSFAKSLSLHPEIFSDLYVSMIEVGETTGKLATVLKLLSNQMKKDYDMRRRVRGAMIYPGIILSVLFLIGAVMMKYVVPTLSQTITELGVPLPYSTRLIIAISNLVANYSIIVFGSLAAAGYGFLRFLKTSYGKNLIDRASLRTPLISPLIKKLNAARFARTLAYLITAGVPIVRSLEITSRVLGNGFYRRAVEAAASEIQKGKQLNELLRAHPELFQPVMMQMVKVGEETGDISRMLLRVALFFEEDITNTTKNMSTIIEPFLMIFIGAIVGFFAISMMQPIYSSLGNFK